MMNYNVCAYLIYLTVMVFIIVYVGRYCFVNGRIFLISLLKDNVILADSINRILLIGYYLVNIGYSFLKLRDWQAVETGEVLVSSLAKNLGTLILILGALHYVNMFVIFLISKRQSISFTHKSFHT